MSDGRHRGDCYDAPPEERSLDEKEAFGALALLLLAGCTSGKPGAYEKVDEDPAVNSVQYRFKPGQVDKTAMQKTSSNTGF